MKSMVVLFALASVACGSFLPVAQPPHHPAVVLDPHGRPLDTAEVINARALHLQAKVLEGHHAPLVHAAVAPIVAPIAHSVIAPAAVSHQSRVDVRTSPAIYSHAVAAPVLAHAAYAAPVFAGHGHGHWLKKRSLGHLTYSAPIIAPAAVSHQSRVDVISSPAVVSHAVATPKSEERSGTAQQKLLEAQQSADENNRMCKVLENRAQQDEERMDQLTNQLKEARLLAEDADGKSDEVSRKLAFVEDELEVAEDRVKSGDAKISELEEELKVVGNSLKSLEVSEEKANQRVEEFKKQLKTLTGKLKEAEARAEYAEKTVKKLQKEVDRLEDELGINKDRYKSLADEMDSTFAELAGY